MDTAASQGDEFEGQSRDDLVVRIRNLEAELQAHAEQQENSSARRKRITRFTTDVGLRTFFGSRTYTAAIACWDAWSAWVRAGRRSDWPEAPTRDLVAALLARFTRAGLLLLVLAGTPLVLAVVQVVILIRQNDLIDRQTELAEASRRSALIVELTSILDEIDEELDQLPSSSAQANTPSASNQTDDEALAQAASWTDRPSLSGRLEGRIAALSKSLRPYRYLAGADLTMRATSPERGQLLLALISAGIDLSRILGQSDFSFADVPETELSGIDLSVGCENRDALYNGEWHSEGEEIQYMNLFGANFQGANLMSAALRCADLSNADFRRANLLFADLRSAELTEANLQGADLSHADLRGANLQNADLKGAMFAGANLTYVDEVTASQLCRASSLSDVVLDPVLLEEVRQNKGCAWKLR